MAAAGKGNSRVRITVSQEAPPPAWAVKQRQLISMASAAAEPFVAKYTRPDGTLIWRDKWPGMDGSDDPYEGFSSFPLLYSLGGVPALNDKARRQWDAITRQFTAYGQIHNEFDAYYDWMHHGEGYQIIYYFGLADPYNEKDRSRAVKFAAMYMGQDPEAPNYDPALRLIRSPLNGGRGPRLETTAEDWCTHRSVYDLYLAPYEDIPGYSTASDPMTKLKWTDDEIFGRILKLINERMTRGDVPLNLASTGLVTSAFLYTGDEKYRRWVLDYFEAWWERTRRNGGIIPDNVGLSGKIGEYNGGKWWGGYYGYRWSHGWRTIMEATLGAAANCVLLTGDMKYLDLPRSQLDLIWNLGRRQDGVFVVPHRYGDGGWFDYRKPETRFHILLYHLSQTAEDLARLKSFDGRAAWPDAKGAFGKGPIMYNSIPWKAWLFGENPGYPEQSLDETMAQIDKRLTEIERDDLADAPSWDVHHWQKRDPVIPGPLSQQMMGADWLYHGCLIHARLRWFDAATRRPGVPDGVAALIESVTPDSTTVSVVNTADEVRTAIVQGGAYGEHQFTQVSVAGGAPVQVDSQTFELELKPRTQARMSLGMKRFARIPTYDFPWIRGDQDMPASGGR
jgi:hypothetical protein